MRLLLLSFAAATLSLFEGCKAQANNTSDLELLVPVPASSLGGLARRDSASTTLQEELNLLWGSNNGKMLPRLIKKRRF